MKKRFRILTTIAMITVFSAGVYSFANSNDHHPQRTTVEETVSMTCKYDQCRATAKSTGQRCRHCVSNYGDSYCWQHK